MLEPMGSGDSITKKKRFLTPFLHQIRGEEQFKQQILSLTNRKRARRKCGNEQGRNRLAISSILGFSSKNCGENVVKAVELRGVSSELDGDPSLTTVVRSKLTIMEKKVSVEPSPLPSQHASNVAIKSNQTPADDKSRQLRQPEERPLNVELLLTSQPGNLPCPWGIERDWFQLSDSSLPRRPYAITRPRRPAQLTATSGSHGRCQPSCQSIFVWSMIFALTSTSLLPPSAGFDLFSRQRPGIV